MKKCAETAERLKGLCVVIYVPENQHRLFLLRPKFDLLLVRLDLCRLQSIRDRKILLARIYHRSG